MPKPLSACSIKSSKKKPPNTPCSGVLRADPRTPCSGLVPEPRSPNPATHSPGLRVKPGVQRGRQNRIWIRLPRAPALCRSPDPGNLQRVPLGSGSSPEYNKGTGALRADPPTSCSSLVPEPRSASHAHPNMRRDAPLLRQRFDDVAPMVEIFIKAFDRNAFILAMGAFIFWADDPGAGYAINRHAGCAEEQAVGRAG